MGGEVRGYLLGCRFPLRNQFRNFLQNFSLFGRIVTRYRRYTTASRRFVHWIFLNGWREVPAAPGARPIFISTSCPTRAASRARAPSSTPSWNTFAPKGEKSVYGQMVSFANRRGEKMFQRYGFKVLNRMEITKYRRLHPEPVYLCTVVKDLEKNAKLYAEN